MGKEEMRLVILGMGGYGRTIADVASQTGKYDEILFLDDNSHDARVRGRCSEFVDYMDGNTEFYPAIGDNNKRYQWILELDSENASIATIIHPSAYVSPLAVIGKGTAILPMAVVNTNVIICYGAIINIGAVVDHDCLLGVGVHIAPGAVVKGENAVSAFEKIESGTVIETAQFPISKTALA